MSIDLLCKCPLLEVLSLISKLFLFNVLISVSEFRFADKKTKENL